jgi:hypothetical protein
VAPRVIAPPGGGDELLPPGSEDLAHCVQSIATGRIEAMGSDATVRVVAAQPKRKARETARSVPLKRPH